MAENNEEYIDGTLAFDETTGDFWIIDVTTEQGLEKLKFDSVFQVEVDGSWVDSGFQIDSGADGDLVFKLKNTKVSGVIEGQHLRIKK